MQYSIPHATFEDTYVEARQEIAYLHHLSGIASRVAKTCSGVSVVFVRYRPFFKVVGATASERMQISRQTSQKR
eukprot:3475401-Amphidinium_carterae.1